MALRAEQWIITQQRQRNDCAAKWREARVRLAGDSGNVRPVLLRLWNQVPYPANPSDLLDFLTRYDRGKVNLDRPPWVHGSLKPLAPPAPLRPRLEAGLLRRHWRWAGAN
jgi:hypothetical protein